ncbi:MAG: ParB/RepB/Spo0J family partition protein [Armatimonadota bacterium]|nr:ParB/RepB/Spo0J family partition protein [Armatimonadota bacterium]
MVEVPVDRIRPNALQPRTGFGEEPLSELQASIRQHGVLQPILLRPTPGQPGSYEIIAGERRWRAASAAGMKTIPAIIRHLDNRGALEAALVENLQREDLNPVERGRAYRRLMDDFGLTQEEIARRVGRSQSSVANTVRLLALPPEIQASIESGRISEGHARALATVRDQDKMISLWRKVEAKGWSVRATEAAARRASISREMARKRQPTREINIIEQNLASSLGAPVRVLVRRRGAGEIRIGFFSSDDLDRLVGALMEVRPR